MPNFFTRNKPTTIWSTEGTLTFFKLFKNIPGPDPKNHTFSKWDNTEVMPNKFFFSTTDPHQSDAFKNFKQLQIKKACRVNSENHRYQDSPVILHVSLSKKLTQTTLTCLQ